MSKLFIDKKTKNFERIRKNKFLLLSNLYFKMVWYNKTLFLFTSFIAVFSALINFNFSRNLIDFFTNNDEGCNSLNIFEIKYNFRIRYLFGSANFLEISWNKFILFLILSAFFLKGFFSVLHWYLNTYSSSKIQKDLKVELFEILTNADYCKSSEISGKLITQFASDLDNIAETIWWTPNRFIYVAASIFLNFYYGFFDKEKNNKEINVYFIFVMSFLFISLFISIFFLLKKATKLSIEAKELYETNNQFIFERLKKLEYIKTNSSEKFEQEKISKTLNDTFDRSKVSLLWTVLFKTVPIYIIIPIIPLLFLFIITILIHPSQVMLANNDFMFKNIVAYFISVRSINSEVNKILDSTLELEDLSSDVSILTDRIKSLSQEKDELNIFNDYRKNEKLGNIVFDNVSFVYPSRPDKLVIDNLSFVFEEGKKYGIAGKNGIGKSTITKILLNLYKISGGKVLIGNKDLNEISSIDLHRRISHLTNHPSFFNMSIAENIFYPFVYEKNEKNLKKLVSASKKAKIFNFIESLPLGFDTVLKENGSDLSEGQKQQIESIRLFIKDYDVYILDEILSNVHPLTRKKILKNIFDHLKNKTVITIDHQYDVFDHMDHLYTFSNQRLSKIKSSDLDQKKK